MIKRLREMLKIDHAECLSEQPKTTIITVGNIEDLELNANAQFNPNSQTWHFLNYYINQRINTLRRHNDSPKLDERKTNIIRGGIKELQNIITIAQEQDKILTRTAK